MSFLNELNKKLSEEIQLKKGYIFEKEEDDEEEEDEEKGGGGRSYEYRSTSKDTKGKIFAVEYDIDYKDLLVFLKEEVPSISWTLPKVRQTFKAIRDFTGFSDKRKEDK